MISCNSSAYSFTRSVSLDILGRIYCNLFPCLANKTHICVSAISFFCPLDVLQRFFHGPQPLPIKPPFTFSFYSIKRRTSNLGPVAFLWRRAAQPPCGNLYIKEAVFRNSSSEKLGLGCASCGRFSDSIGWLPSAQTGVATSPRTGMIIPARWVYIHPWMSSGTLHFPAILVTVTCNPRRCVRTPWSGRERKDFFSEQPPDPGVHFPVWAFGTYISQWKSQRVTTTEGLPPYLRRVVWGFAAVHCCAYTLGYPSPKAPRDHLSLVFGRRGLLHKKAGTQRKAQRMSDAKPRTSLRSYWHTLPKKKEQTPLKTGVRYNKFPSTFSRSRTWTLPLIQLPASKQLAFL